MNTPAIDVEKSKEYEIIQDTSSHPEHGVVIALRTTSCFSVPCHALNNVDNLLGPTLSFELEQFVPLDAEEMLVARPSSHGGLDVFTVFRRDVVDEAIHETEVEGLHVASVTPKVFLTVQRYFELTSERNVSDILVFDAESGWDHLQLRDGSVTEWHWYKELSFDVLDDRFTGDGALDRKLLVIGANEAIVELLGLRKLVPNVVLGDKSCDQYQGEMANRLIQGMATPWTVIQQDSNNSIVNRWAPIKRPLMLSLGLICLSLTYFCSLLIYQSFQLTAVVHQADDSQVAIFQELYPRVSVPANVLSRLQSEHRRLQLAQSELNAQPPIRSALPALVHFLNTLPNEMIFRIDSIRMKGDEITQIDGATRSLQDIETLISAMRGAGYEFQPPSTSQMADGFTIRLEKLVRKAVVRNKIAIKEH